ncbi:unnamed protein product [Caenorhabditis sp. 36 PRJEB53466]|nr:unnamed protein product [Caenorhabditis sp. 36 PRJEB53466]
MHPTATILGRVFLILYGLVGVPFTLLTIADLGLFLNKFLKYLLTSAHRFSRFLKNLWHGIRKKPRKTISESERSEVRSTGKEKKEMSMRTVREPDQEEKIQEMEKEEKKGEEEGQEEQNEQPRKTEESIALGITLTCYLLACAKILSVYEPEMDFFKALYFNFVTLTTIGLCDFVPKR